MKFKRIRSRMLVFIIPVIAVAYIIMMMASILESRKILYSQIDETMNATLSSVDGELGEYLNSVSEMATTIANIVESTSTVTDMPTYEKMLANIISENEIVLGSGLWFEPYAYDKEEKYMGPYVYKDGSSIVTTYDYSNAEYDYFSQEYYINAMNATEAVFTDPYYDETSGLIMSSCSAPIIVNGKAIGCVTVDIELTALEEVINSIKIGDSGSAVLTTAGGTMLAGVDESYIQAAANISEHPEMAVLANAIAEPKGVSSYVDSNGLMNVYFDTLSATGWKILLQISDNELRSGMRNIKNVMFAITIVTLAFVVVVIIRQVNVITRGIVKVQQFSGELSEGNFTVEEIQTKETDEIGSMSAALNTMFQRNRSVISNIAGKAVNIDESSLKLRDAAEKLNTQFADIKEYMNEVNDAMTSTSAATEEVNASVEEVFSSVNLLAEEADSCKSLASEIQNRADVVRKSSEESSETAINLGKQFESQLKISIENSAVVENISEMASVISNIAEEINLLSLNASIEAARAGEAGKGFAVVASEIGGLAGETASAVSSIQDTISQVHDAFNELTRSATELLDFVQKTVTPDYTNFVNIAKQYGDDAISFAEVTSKMSSMSDNIREIMQEVTEAIQSVAEATTETTETSGRVLEAIIDVGGDVEVVSEMSNEQEEIAEDLNSVVSKFKL